MEHPEQMQESVEQVETSSPVEEQTNLIGNVEQSSLMDNEQQIVKESPPAIELDDEFNVLLRQKIREKDALSLNQILRIHTEMEIMRKVKEEAAIWTLNNHLEVFRANKKQLENEILHLTKVKENVDKEMQKEKLVCTQISNQMEMTGKMVALVVQNYKTSKADYQELDKKVTTFEQQQNNEIEMYEKEKEVIRCSVRKTDEKLKELHKCLENDHNDYVIELKKKNAVLMNATEAEENSVSELAEIETKYKNLHKEHEHNKKILSELTDKNLILQNAVDGIDLPNLENIKATKAQEYEESVMAINSEVSQINEKLTRTENEELAVMKTFEDNKIRMQELDKIANEKDNELSIISAKQVQLKERMEAMNLSLHSIREQHRYESENINKTLLELDREVQEIDEKNNETDLNLCKMKAARDASEKYLYSLQDSIKQLKENEVLNANKLREFEEKCRQLEQEIIEKSELLKTLKGKHQKVIDLDNEKLRKLDEEIKEAGNRLENTKQEVSLKIRDYEHEKSKQKSEMEKCFHVNEEQNKKVLGEMNERLIKLRNDFDMKKEEFERSRAEINIKKKAVSPALPSGSQNISSFGILKPIKPPTPRKRLSKSPTETGVVKKVSWRVPSTSSIESNSERDVNNKSAEQLFDELFKDLD